MSRLQAPARWTLAAFERLYAALSRLAPFSARDLRDAGARTTFRAVCIAGFDRHGWFGLVREGVRECADLTAAIMRARFDEGRTQPRESTFRAMTLGRDVRLAMRSLWTGRRTTAIAAITLALGIGINAAVFSVLDAVVWRQVPFRDAARLVTLWNFNIERKFAYAGFSRRLIQEWRGQTDLFDRVEAHEPASFIHDTGRGSEMVSGAVVTPGLFELLAVGAAEGRTFGVGDGRGGSSRLAVISDAFWRERLGAPADITRRDITLNGAAYRVIGVMPASFRFPSGLEEVWTPVDVDQPPPDVIPGRGMTPLARLAAGVTFAQAADQARARGERLSAAAGGPPGMTAQLISPGEFLSDERTERSLWILSGAVGFLFLIVCANVANLALSRSLTRARDLATLAALGASPRDLVRMAAIEQILLAGAGSLAGVGVAAVAVRAAVAALPDSMTLETLNVIDLDMRTMLFMVAAGATAALIFGLTPAAIAARTSLSGVLGRDGRTTMGSKPARRFRGALAVSEVAVSVVLLVGSALMARSFIRLASADQGFDARGLITVRLGLPASGYKDVPLRDRVTLEIAERMTALPDVDGVTVGGLPSETNLVTIGKLEVEGQPGTSGEVFVPLHEVPPNYFSVMGLPLVAGRAFRADEAADSVIVNQRFAAKHLQGRDPVGRRFRIEGKPWRTVIGVAGDTVANTESGGQRLEWYYPIGAASDAFRPTMARSAIIDYRTLIVRSAKPDAVIRQLTSAVSDRDASIVIWKVSRVEHQLADAIARPRVVFLMMSVFAGFGLALAMAGLYGVLSCLVTQRRQEIGVRIALGATSRQVRWLVLGNGLALTGIGLLIGLAAAIPLVRAMRSILYDVNPSDPAAIIAATLLLSLTAAFACWWPARDAGRINPVELLRGE
jgi:putative ABC transport system permease protein